MSEFHCASCKAKIGLPRIICYWPNRIQCTKCRARLKITSSWLVGTIHYTLLIIASYAIFLFAEQFETKIGNVYVSNPWQTLLRVFAIPIAVVVISPIYLRALGRYFQLTLRVP